MSTQKTTQKDVESWELSDELWEKIEPLLPKPKSRLRGRGRHRRDVGGRPASDRRRVMAGILYLMRTGGHWNAAPKEYGSGKTLHRYFQKWTRAGVFKKLWKAGLLEYDQAKGIVWTCLPVLACAQRASRRCTQTGQAVDGAMTKAPLGGGATGPNPTDRAKCGTKRSLLCDGRGAPLGIAVSGANRHDSVLLDPTLEAVVIPRPQPTEKDPQHLCADLPVRARTQTGQGYIGQPCEQTTTAHGYILHRSSLPVADRREEDDGRNAGAA